MNPSVIDLSDGPSGPDAVEADPAVTDSVETSDGFSVSLDGFSGPFDLLLSLIAKHKLEVTELALSQVTDDFCAYIREQGSDWDLEETTNFLVVAATLLDLKAARLLPSGDVEDEEDLALLEARDLLFARLLQYRAFKEVAGSFESMLAANEGVIARGAGLDPEFLGLLPEVELKVTPQRFAELAELAMTEAQVPMVGVDHIHNPPVSVAEQTGLIASRLRGEGSLTFRALVNDAETPGHVIARFLGLLELYRQGRVAFEQVAALADLLIRWVELGDDQTIVVSDEYDEVDQSTDEADEATPTGEAGTSTTVSDHRTIDLRETPAIEESDVRDDD